MTRTSAARRRTLRWVVAGALLGALVALAAGFATVNGDGVDAAAAAPPPTTVHHKFPASYGGDVWITVKAPDPQHRNVTIAWGPWQRGIDHEVKGTRTYVFTKYPKRDGETNVPVYVTVDPGARVTFGSGKTPASSIDVNDGWTPRDG